MNNTENLLSKDFLEKALGREISSFKISPGTKVGDNYSSTMYSIEVSFANCTETSYLISKCYPANPSRQDILVQTNLFWRELSFYRDYLPKLIQMQKCMKLAEIIKPTFPPLVAGNAANFYNEPAIPGKIFAPFDNYVMMVDIRKTFGFRMADRLKSLDKNHMTLAMKSLARNHALGWAYKQKNNLTAITEQFPFMSNEYSLRPWKTFMIDMTIANGKKGCDAVEQNLGKDSPVTKGIKNFVEMSTEILDIHYSGCDRNEKELDKFFRVKPEIFEHEKLWNLPILGDTWSNNLLFRYNEETGIPEEVIHVDLQMCTEGCPTSDLVYMIYISTDSEFRKLYLEDMLKIYVETFMNYCSQLDTKLPWNFSLQEFKRRFHRSKLYGYCLAILALPMALIDADKIEDLDSKEGENVTEILSSVGQNNKNNDRYVNRIVALSSELYEQGVI